MKLQASNIIKNFEEIWLSKDGIAQRHFALSLLNVLANVAPKLDIEIHVQYPATPGNVQLGSQPAVESSSGLSIAQIAKIYTLPEDIVKSHCWAMTMIRADSVDSPALYSKESVERRADARGWVETIATLEHHLAAEHAFACNGLTLKDICEIYGRGFSTSKSLIGSLVPIGVRASSSSGQPPKLYLRSSVEELAAKRLWRPVISQEAIEKLVKNNVKKLN